jgi:hypothetical protein
LEAAACPGIPHFLPTLQSNRVDQKGLMAQEHSPFLPGLVGQTPDNKP